MSFGHVDGMIEMRRVVDGTIGDNFAPFYSVAFDGYRTLTRPAHV